MTVDVDSTPRDVVGRAVSLLWSLAFHLPESGIAEQRDRADRLQLQRLATDALQASLLGRALLGRLNVEEPPPLRECIDLLPGTCQALVETCDFNDSIQVEFAGRVADVHRGVKRLGYLD